MGLFTAFSCKFLQNFSKFLKIKLNEIDLYKNLHNSHSRNSQFSSKTYHCCIFAFYWICFSISSNFYSTMLFKGKIFGLQRISLYFSYWEKTRPFWGKTALSFFNNWALCSITMRFNKSLKGLWIRLSNLHSNPNTQGRTSIILKFKFECQDWFQIL